MRRLVRLGCLTAILLVTGVACNLITGHEAPLRVQSSDAATGERDVDDVRETPDVSTCAPGEVTCSGRCTSLANDVDNCGRCGRHCDSLPCSDGRCPAELVTNIGPWGGGLAEKGSYLYWTTDTDGTVKRISKSGGKAETLATLGFAPSGLIVRDGFVYVAVQGGTIARVPEEGGAPVVLAKTFKPAGIAIRGDEIFFVQYSAPYGEVGRVLLDGGALQILATAHNPLYVAADETNVYFTAHYDLPATTTADDRGVWRASKTKSGELRHLLTGSVPSGLPIDDAGVYSADQLSGTLVRIEHDGGAVIPLAKQTDVAGVCADDSHVYFATTSGVVGRVSKQGGAVLVLAIGPPLDPFTAFLAVDDARLYWTATEKIMRTPK